MKFHVVTTTNESGWEQTGRRMAQSFLDRWKMPLTVYAEGFDPDLPVHVRRLPAWMDILKAKYENAEAYHGRRFGQYDFRFDLVKFAHKAAALTDFGLSVNDGVMIWLDADTYTHEDVDEEWLAGMFPEPAYIAWLERQGSAPETGFVMFRASHPYHAQFMESIANIYTSGAVTRLPEWHDAYVIWHVARSKMTRGKIPPAVNLSGDSRWHHPFVNGPLGAKMDHMKGSRKVEGRSRPRDTRRPRSEPYWNG